MTRQGQSWVSLRQFEIIHHSQVFCFSSLEFDMTKKTTCVGATVLILFIMAIPLLCQKSVTKMSSSSLQLIRVTEHLSRDTKIQALVVKLAKWEGSLGTSTYI